jgi:glycerol uptake facilitator-like aquaporin
MFKEAMPFFAEFLGTFLLVLSILVSNNNPLFVGGAVALIVWFASSISGAHINPAVSLMRFLGGKLESMKLAGFVAAQIAGAVACLYVFKIFA